MRAFDDAGFRQFEEWDVRIVPQDKLERLPGKASQQQVWFRHRDPLPDDYVLHICALAYMSDLTLLGSAQVHHPRSASTCRSRRWTTRCGSCGRSAPTSGCSMTSRRRRRRGGPGADAGQDLHAYGEMVAAVMQEGLTRYQRDFTPR